MAQFTRMLYYWAKSEKMYWGEQNRDDRSLSWGESFRQFWWMSALGIVLLWLVVYYVFAADTPEVQSTIGLTKMELLFWYFPLLFGLITSVWFVRFTSMEIPWLDRVQWFSSPQEVEPHFVLRATQRLQLLMNNMAPESITAIDAISNPWFYLRHRERCKRRYSKYAFWFTKLNGRNFAELSDTEKMVVFSELNLYESFHCAWWIKGS